MEEIKNWLAKPTNKAAIGMFLAAVGNFAYTMYTSGKMDYPTLVAFIIGSFWMAFIRDDTATGKDIAKMGEDITRAILTHQTPDVAKAVEDTTTVIKDVTQENTHEAS